MPPNSVPHSDPMPPITTASNAKMSWVGPLTGSNTERMPRKRPPRAAIATAIAVARAYTLRLSMPTSSAASASSAVARITHPARVRDRKT